MTATPRYVSMTSACGTKSGKCIKPPYRSAAAPAARAARAARAAPAPPPRHRHGAFTGRERSHERRHVAGQSQGEQARTPLAQCPGAELHGVSVARRRTNHVQRVWIAEHRVSSEERA